MHVVVYITKKPQDLDAKKVRIFSQKSVDNCRFRWYSNQALERVTKVFKRGQKDFKKKSKKPLDKRKLLSYNNKAVAERAQRESVP